jgi:hypothetical protein
MKVMDWDGLSIENNTIFQTGKIASAYGKPVRDLDFRNNIIFQNEYGVKGDNMGSGQEVIDFYFSGGSFSNNVIIGENPSMHRDKNFYPATITQVGFRNAANGDYMISAQSPFSTERTTGAAVGAKLDRKEVGRSGGVAGS